MADFLGVAAYKGTSQWLTSGGDGEPEEKNHGQFYTDGGHTIHYGDAHIRVKHLSTDLVEDGEGIVIGRVGNGTTDNGSALQLESFTTTERGYLTPSVGMLLWNETDGKPQVYNGSAWVDFGSVYEQLDVRSNYFDQYSCTLQGSPTFVVGGLVDIKYYNGSVESDVGQARLVYYLSSGGVTIRLDDNDGKGTIAAPSGGTEYRIYPDGDAVNYVRVDTIDQEESTDGVQITFGLNNAPDLTTLLVYLNGILLQRVDDATMANNWGADAYWYSAGGPSVVFGVSHAPAQGEELKIFYRQA